MCFGLHDQRVLLRNVWMLSVLVLSSLARANAQDVMTEYHVAKLRTVTDAVISPDGKQVAYTLAVPRNPFADGDGIAFSELHVVDQNGHSRGFITGEVGVQKISWSGPNQINFLAKRGKDKDASLYAIALDGGEAKKLVEHDPAISAYSFSPQRDRVAFLATAPLSKEEKDAREKGFTQEIYEEDGRVTKVWIAKLGSKEKPVALNIAGSVSELEWSPAGDQLAVAIAQTPLVDDNYMHRKVHIVDATTGAIQAKFDHPAKLGPFAWSPDGKHVAVILGEDINDPHEGRLYLWSAQGERLRELVPNYEGQVEAVVWRDANTLVYLTHEGVFSTVAEVQLNGMQRKTLIPAGGPVLGKLTMADDGSAAVVGESPSHPFEVFSVPAAGVQIKRLTNSNDWLSKLKLAKQEVVKHKARDGLELQGILIRPLDEQPGKRYPLILAVHGGPESHVPQGWVTQYANPGQVAAARGFAVFYPNYRGSTGRGIKFSKLGQADAAGKEFDDLVDAVDHLIGTGLVDGKKVGITGGSYGGYASAWGATYYSERFAASVMFVGISNNISKVGTTDIPTEMYHVHHRKWLWDDFEYFRRASPIAHVQKGKTPLLILHGKEDPRVHPSQSLELHRHLKVLNQTPVRLVLYPGEGHGNRRAASRLDYNLRMLQWFEHYLKGPGGQPPAYQLSYEAEKAK